MSNYYIPYTGKKPAAAVINGHKLLIMAQEASAFDEQLEVLGADRVRKVVLSENKDEQERRLALVAKSVKAGLVIAPGEVSVVDVIKNLEAQLPWIQ